MNPLILSLLTASAMTAAANSSFVYVGSYTKGPEEGISLLKMDDETGTLENLGFVAAAPNPTFLALDPKGEHLYAIHERQPGSVAAYKIDRTTGKLTLLNTEKTSGNGPCHVSVCRDGKNLLVANYGSGSVACLPIRADGSLAPHSAFVQHTGHSVDKDRQKEPHAHGIYQSPGGKFVLACDLGTDKVYVYRFDPARGSLEPNDPPAGDLKPGAGPRHAAFSTDGKRLYVINELDCTVTVFSWDEAKGVLQAIESVSTLKEPVDGNSTAEVEVHPGNARVLYGSNRGANTIVRFSVDPDTGKLTYQDETSTTGPAPRHFATHPNGKWMLAGNQNAETLVSYKVDPATGKLSQHGQPLPLRSPVCMVFLPRK